MTDSLPSVSIVVPTFRRPEILAMTVDALASVDYPVDRLEIIIVNDGSADATAGVLEVLRERYRSVKSITQANQGVATARNVGAAAARGEILIFVDDDILVQPDFVHQHLSTLARFNDCLVNGHWEFAPDLAATLNLSPFGRFRISVEQWVKQGLNKTALTADCVQPEAVTACNLAMARAAFRKIGGFDEQFPFAGYEDQEFSLRAAECGYRFVYNKKLLVYHNDHRLTLRQFCERQYRGAITAALMAVKHPARRAHHPLVIENGWISIDDSLQLKLKKICKQMLSLTPVLSLLVAGVGLLERVRVPAKLLNRCYWSLCGLFIFKGFREGLRRYGHSRPQQALKRLRDVPASVGQSA